MAIATWEDAVDWYRDLPDNEQAIRANYFDQDIVRAAKRFAASPEFLQTLSFIPNKSGRVLDIGAGMGIASYAFAANGFSVTALEPDTSEKVGAGAIRQIAEQCHLDITVIEGFAEDIACRDADFDIVYARQVLHHAHNLEQLCVQAFRVLKKGGTFIAVREHVIEKQEDLELFLQSHPLHHLYGGENAFTLARYRQALENAGLKVKIVLRPFDSVVNYHPSSQSEVLDRAILSALEHRQIHRGKHYVKRMFKPIVSRSPMLQRWFTDELNKNHYLPGNIYSFVATKQ